MSARARWLAASAALVGVLGLLEAGLLPRHPAQRASDLLQLGLAIGSALACLGAAARGTPAGARTFWLAMGAGCASWAGGQAFWLTEGVALRPGASSAAADVLFVGSTALFLIAFVVRPDRGGVRSLLRAIDAAVVLLAMVYLYYEIAHPHFLVGDVAAYEAWSTFEFNFRGLLLLPALLSALRRASPEYRPLYAGLAPAFVLYQLGGAVSNHAFEGWWLPSYRAGLYDLPWSLPFLWIALVARAWREPAPAPAAPLGHEQGRALRATVTAFVAVLLFPLVHFAIAWHEPPGTLLARARAEVALAGTLLVAGLYLGRQQVVMREAEQALREGEERYRLLLDEGMDGVGVYGPDLRVRYVSGALSGLSGHRPEERIGRFAYEVIHPEDVPRVREAAASLLERPGAVARVEFRSRARDGAWRDLEVDVANRLDTPGVRGLVANFRDVTERRRAERERERSLSLLEATLESTADGILAVGHDGRVARFNQRFAAAFRVPSDLLGEGQAAPLLEFVARQLLDPAELARAESGGAEAASSSTLRLRDGRVFELHSGPQRLAGRVVGRVHSFRDVSDRVHAEQAMARLVTVVQATPDFIAMCDASFRPLHLNRAGRRMLGLPEQGPLAERHLAEYHTPATAARLLEEAVPAALERGAWSGESALRHRAGRGIPVLQVVLAHRSAGGEVEFFSTIATDLSQRVETERRLREGETMAALGSLVAGVAHEVRNPLFGMTSTLDAFEVRLGGNPDYRPYLDVLRGELARLNGLMHDLLEYARPTKAELAPGRFEHVVDSALEACAPLRERCGVDVVASMAPDLPWVRMDRARLAHAVRQLLESAIERTRPAACVRLSVSAAGAAAAASLECRIDDDGPAFAELPRVFEPFFTKRRSGTGLGLAIAQRIVADHGGTLSAANRDGGGISLALSLPAEP